MSQTAYFILFVVSILVVVLIHEAGHFAFAKLFGMKVQEFFVGFGPRLWSFRRGDTEYGVKLLPLGGYVRITGMSPLEEVPEADRDRTYGSKPAWQRFCTIAAGPATHFVIALIFFVAIYWLVGITIRARPEVTGVARTLNGKVSPAAAAGFRAGDQVVGVDGIRNPTENDFIVYTRAHVGRAMRITLEREGHTTVVTATPVLARVGDQRFGRLGIVVGPGDALKTLRTGPLAAFDRSLGAVGRTVTGVVQGMGQVFGPSGIGRIVSELGGAPRSPTGPVSIVGVGDVAATAAVHHDWADVLAIFAAINVFVGLLNLVPLPPFDGGHIAVVVVEKLTRRPVDPRRLVPLAAVVLTFVVAISMSVLYLDIVNPIHTFFP